MPRASVVNELPVKSYLWRIGLYANITLWEFMHESGLYSVQTESDIEVFLNGILIDVVASGWRPQVRRAAEPFNKDVIHGRCVKSGQMIVDFSDGYRAVFSADCQDDQRLFIHVKRSE